jgi:hypothetical protein
MRRVSFISILIWLLLSGHQRLAQATGPTGTNHVYIGFLDDAREELTNWEPGVAPDRLIRPAFERVGSAWRSINASSLPSLMTWTIAYDGRSLGHVKGETEEIEDRITHGRMHHESLTIVQAIMTPQVAIASVGPPSKSFAGLIADGPGKVRRPLVLVSKPYFDDPDGWKRLPQPPDSIARLVRAAFRVDFPRIDRCKNEEVVQHSWRFPDSSLNLPVSYASNKGSFLVETRLNAGDCGYVDDQNDPLSDPWFFVSMDGRAKRIGSFMSLLDAGDYDDDGRSELIFFLSQPEQTDGFILFDAELRKQASLLWTYH